jgi:hypothetical protein
MPSFRPPFSNLSEIVELHGIGKERLEEIGREQGKSSEEARGARR